MTDALIGIRLEVPLRDGTVPSVDAVSTGTGRLAVHDGFWKESGAWMVSEVRTGRGVLLFHEMEQAVAFMRAADRLDWDSPECHSLLCGPIREIAREVGGVVDTGRNALERGVVRDL